MWGDDFMYEVFYNLKQYEFKTSHEVMTFITSFECSDNITKHLIRIKFNKRTSYLEIGIGMQDKSMLFYFPGASSLEDSKISHNEMDPDIYYSKIPLPTFSGQIFKCIEYNLIEYQDAIKELKFQRSIYSLKFSSFPIYILYLTLFCHFHFNDKIFELVVNFSISSQNPYNQKKEKHGISLSFF